MKVLIGSAAIWYWKNQGVEVDLTRRPKDSDYFTDQDLSGYRVETFYHPNLYLWNWSGEVASLDELYTIKISHSYWIVKDTANWNKHMFHAYHLKKAGAKLIPKLHDILYTIWEERYGAKRVNLNASAEDFFNSTVLRVYDHDSIHASVAYYDEPLFKRILKGGSEVAVDKKKFGKLSQLLQERLVFEELYATTLEREIIPRTYHIRKNEIQVLYFQHLRKLITSYSKGWFATYVADNFGTFRKPEVDFLNNHLYNSERLEFLDTQGEK